MSQDGTWVFGFVGLEGDVVVGDALVGVVGLGGGGALRRSWRWRIGVAAAAFAAAAGLAEQGEFVDEDLGLVFLLAGLLVVPGAGLDLAFDEELCALLDVVADDLGGALEGDEVVPLGLVGPVALLILLRSAVARVKLAMVMPPAVARISGLCRRCREGRLC